MTKRPSPPPPLHISFDPVPVAARHDGWTPEKQRVFIDALVRFGCVAEAARFVGMSARSAYRLYNRPDADSFAAAWDTALSEGRRRMRDAAVTRIFHGERIPVYYAGRKIGERVHFDARLGIAVLNCLAAELHMDPFAPSPIGTTQFPWDGA